MGKEFFRRPIMSDGTTAGSTVGSVSDLRVGGVLSAIGNMTLSADLTLPTSSVTAVAAAVTLMDHGVSFITEGTSGSAKSIILPKPPRAGAVKYVFISKNTSSEQLTVYTNSTADAQNFFGTTYNEAKIAASTTNPAGTPFLMLVGASTNQWAITVGSTINWDFAASTGSTAQA